MTDKREELEGRYKAFKPDEWDGDDYDELIQDLFAALREMEIDRDGKGLCIDHLKGENARLRAAYSEACRAAYNEVVPDCGETMGVAVYHAVKTVLRKALEDK